MSLHEVQKWLSVMQIIAAAPVSLALIETGLVALGVGRDRFSRKSRRRRDIPKGGGDGDKQAA
jgi:hypothetical protein